MNAIAISERAYYIWEQQGRPEGMALGHWLQAEAEIKAAAAAREMSSVRPATVAAAAARKSPAKKASRKRGAPNA